MKRFKMDKYFQIPMVQEPADGESRWSVRSPFLILMSIVMALVLVVGIIQHKSSTSSKVSTPAEKRASTAELLKLFNPSSLVEAKTLRDLPADLRSQLGIHGTNFDWIADVGEPCNPTDVVSKDYPSKCFLVGGLSATSALISYKRGGYEGQSGVGVAYVYVNSEWRKVESWRIGYPSDLKELREMTSFPPDDRSILH